MSCSLHTGRPRALKKRLTLLEGRERKNLIKTYGRIERGKINTEEKDSPDVIK